jgi:hypothetical protein
MAKNRGQRRADQQEQSKDHAGKDSAVAPAAGRVRGPA